MSAFPDNVSKLIGVLQSESEVILEYFKKNQTIENPDKFQVITIDKKKGDHTNENIVINTKQIKSVPSIELSRIQLNNKLNFISHMDNIFMSAPNPFNALIRAWNYNTNRSNT